MLAQQWAGLFTRGKALGPSVGLLSASGYGFLARRAASQSSSRSFLGALVLSIGIVPFTLLVMDTTNRALLRVAAGEDKLEDGAVRELLSRWRAQNLVRSLLPLTSAALGLWTLFG